MTIKKILDVVSQYKCPLVEITGGEPLLQEETPKLAKILSERGFKVLVETNGTQNIDLLKDGIIRIVDIKTPGSGESDKTDWKNLDRLYKNDEVKFVLVNFSDYEWAKSVIRRYNLTERVTVLFSPANGVGLDPAEVAQWILDDRLNVKFQLQLHKIIWPDKNEGK